MKTVKKTNSRKPGKTSSKSRESAHDESRNEAAQAIATLVAEATAVRKNAYAPYSKYKVGAAVLTESGDVFVGCNVENASYGATICAERAAVMHMIAAGGKKPLACAIVTQGKKGGSPCGICRQVLAEFAEDMTIILSGESGVAEDIQISALSDLLPNAFRASALSKR